MINQGQFLKAKLKEAQQLESFNDKIFWANIGTTHSTGYELCKLSKLPPKYRKLVEKHFRIIFPEPGQMVNMEFGESLKDIQIRKHKRIIVDKDNLIKSLTLENEELKDELLLYLSQDENKITIIKNENDNPEKNRSIKK